MRISVSPGKGEEVSLPGTGLGIESSNNSFRS